MRVTPLPLRARPARGFTLLELMVVIAILATLVALAVGQYQHSVTRSKEAVLKENLFVLRQAIDQYTLDKQQAPQSLEELVSAGYLRSVPTDPITQQRDWRVEFGDTLFSVDQTLTGITDVHSSADRISPFEGTPYSSW